MFLYSKLHVSKMVNVSLSFYYCCKGVGFIFVKLL